MKKIVVFEWSIWTETRWSIWTGKWWSVCSEM